MSLSCVVVVAYHDDPFSNRVAEILQGHEVTVLQVVPSNLARLNVLLKDDTFLVEHHPVKGIVFRVAPDRSFSGSFVQEDQGFCDAEIRAVWLAALHLESILAVNRYDATVWFENANWIIWRSRLIQAGIPVSPFYFGDFVQPGEWIWYPYKSYAPKTAPGRSTRRLLGTALTQVAEQQPVLVIGGQPVGQKINSTVEDATQLLMQWGVQVAQIWMDGQGCILKIDTLPNIFDPDVSKQAAVRIGELFYDHLHRR